MSFNLWRIFGLIAAAGLVQLLSAWRWRVLLKFIKYKISYRKALGYYLSGFAVSYIMPVAAVGGRPAKAFLMNYTEGLPIKTGLVAALVEVFLEFMTDITFILIVLPLLIFHFSFSERFEFSVTATVILLFLVIVYIFQQARKGGGIISSLFKFLKLEKHLGVGRTREAFLEGEKLFSKFFQRQNKLLWQGIGLSFAVMVAGLLQVVAIFWLIGLPLTFVNIVLARALLHLAYLVPVPGALGVSEWFQAGFFSATGMSSGVGVAFSVLYKAADLLYVLCGLSFIAYAVTHYSIHKNKFSFRMIFNNGENSLDEKEPAQPDKK